MIVEVDLSVDDRTACWFWLHNGQYDRRGRSVCGRQNSLLISLHNGQYDRRGRSVCGRQNSLLIWLYNGQYDRRGRSVCGRQNSLLISLHKGQYDDRSRFPCARQIMQLADVHSRAGSVIVAADAVVLSDSVRSSAASLAVALLDITGLNATVAGQTGPVGAVVGDVTGESEYIYSLLPRRSSCLFAFPSLCLCLRLPLCLPFHRCLRLPFYFSIIPHLHLSGSHFVVSLVCLSFCRCICLSVIPSLYLSVIRSLYFSCYHSVVVLTSQPFRRCTCLSVIPSLYLSIIPSLY